MKNHKFFVRIALAFCLFTMILGEETVDAASKTPVKNIRVNVYYKDKTTKKIIATRKTYWAQKSKTKKIYAKTIRGYKLVSSKNYTVKFTKNRGKTFYYKKIPPAPKTSPNKKTVKYKLTFNTVPTNSTPQSGYGLWTGAPNYITAHNPGVGQNFIKLNKNDKVKINGRGYKVDRRVRIWGPSSVYPLAPAKYMYCEYCTHEYLGTWMFDGRMTLQTCADNGLRSVWVVKLNKL